MQETLLQMSGISKRFPGVVALDDVSFSVGRGEIVALIGENGAGKSTLMKTLGGVYEPDGGEIMIDGAPARIRSVADAGRHGIGFVHQELNVLDNLDIAGNVFLGREPLYGGPLRLIDRKKMYAETNKYLRHLGLKIPSKTLLAKLSLAERQMVEIAKALSQNARLLILDEPTSSLTLTETNRLLRVLKELKARGVSLIYISHRLGEVQEIADRVAALRDGKNAGTIEREHISHETMVKLMIGRELSNFYIPPAGAPARKNYLEVTEMRTRKFPGKTVSFNVARGEILGFAGLVGAGRTDVAQALFGVKRALAASISLDGKPLDISSPRRAIAQGIYLVPEDRRNLGLITTQPVRENVTLPDLQKFAGVGLLNFKKEKAAAAAVCGELGVKTASIETPAGNLSGGNQQKVVLAKWLSMNPKVLIFDEPTRGVDIGAKAEIYALMRGLAQRGVAIVVISSDMEEVLGISDRIAVMHEGRITGILNREECSEENIMQLAVGGGCS